MSVPHLQKYQILCLQELGHQAKFKIPSTFTERYKLECCCSCWNEEVIQRIYASLARSFYEDYTRISGLSHPLTGDLAMATHMKLHQLINNIVLATNLDLSCYIGFFEAILVEARNMLGVVMKMGRQP